MKIYEFLKQTLKDYPGKIAAEIFTAGCNYQCSTCHAKHVVSGKSNYSEDEVLNYLKKTRGFIDGLVVCGGEPTIQFDLVYFLRKVKKETGLPIKLDTNGSNPFVLGDLVEEKLVDYVAMDIKGPPSLYSKLVGKQIDLRDNVEKGIASVQNFPDFEFRTTLCSIYSEEGQLRYMNLDEAREMAEWVYGFVPRDPREIKWYIQKFIARSNEEMLDSRFSKENLPREYHQTPDKLLVDFRDVLREKFPKTEIR